MVRKIKHLHQTQITVLNVKKNQCPTRDKLEVQDMGDCGCGETHSCVTQGFLKRV